MVSRQPKYSTPMGLMQGEPLSKVFSVIQTHRRLHKTCYIREEVTMIRMYAQGNYVSVGSTPAWTKRELECSKQYLKEDVITRHAQRLIHLHLSSADEYSVYVLSKVIKTSFSQECILAPISI